MSVALDSTGKVEWSMPQTASVGVGQSWTWSVPAMSYWDVSVPLRVVTVVLTVLPVCWITAWLWRWAVARRARSVGMCPRCGYDLRASTGRCPECGRAMAS